MKTFKVKFTVRVRGFFSDDITQGVDIVESESLKECANEQHKKAHELCTKDMFVTIQDITEVD